jgi:gluconolactonase
MKVRRLALVFAALPVACVIYACSSSKTDNPAALDGGGTPPTTPPGTPPTDPPTTPPTDPPPPPPGTDGGTDAGTPTCVNFNPLTADGGGTPDGGVTVNSGVTEIVIENAAGNRGAGTWFLDGPQFIDADGGGILVYSSFDQNGANGQLAKVKGDGTARTSLRTTFTNGGLGIGNGTKAGQILTAVATNADGNGSIAQTSTAGTAGADISTGAVAASPNDLAVGKNGDIYFTDPRYQAGGPTTGIYRIAAAGGAVTAITNGGTTTDEWNGIALNADSTKLYVSSTNGDAVRVYTVNADGTVVATGSVFVGTGAAGGAATTLGGGHPDGLAVDSGGNVWIAEAAAAAANSGAVEVYSPAGKRLGSIPFTGTRPTGVAFGGASNNQVFITTEGTSAVGAADLAKAGVYKLTIGCSGLR